MYIIGPREKNISYVKESPGLHTIFVLDTKSTNV